MATRAGGWSRLRAKVDFLKRTIDLRELFLERYPGRFRRVGRWLIGSSPYRQDEHPSFGVNEDVYIDFSTGEHGDEIDFVRREQDASFIEAVAVLEERTGMASTPTTPSVERPDSPSEPPPAAWQRVMRAECQQATAALFSRKVNARRVRRWLKQRGLTDATIKKAALGFNAGWRRTRLRDQATGKYVFIPPGILIPCFVEDTLWAVHVRTLPELNGLDRQEGHALPKYLYIRGSKAGVLYQADEIREERDVLLVEGEFDALLARQVIGEFVSVVTLGSASNHLSMRWLTRLKQARRLFSCLDQDEAGRRATSTLRDALGDQLQVVSLPQGKDITEFVTRYKGDLAAWWRAASCVDNSKLSQLSFLNSSPSGIKIQTEGET